MAMTKVVCLACSHTFDSGAEPKNIAAGKVKCKNCGKVGQVQVYVKPAPPKEPPKAPAPVKSKEELEAEADASRRAQVDAKNKAAADAIAVEQAKLAKTPLTAEDLAFILRIAPLMNEGRAIKRPSAADITRYARLLKRKDVK